MATRNAAKILRWDKQLGTLEPGKRADLLVVAGDDGDGHAHLFTRSEHDVELVVINGVPRYGASQVMRKLLGEAAAQAEAVRSESAPVSVSRPAERRPCCRRADAAEATELLADGLKHLPDLAKDLVSRPALDPDALLLVLDHDEARRQRPASASTEPDGEFTAMLDQPVGSHAARRPARAADPGPADGLDDSSFVEALAKEANLPQEVAAHVTDLF